MKARSKSVKDCRLIYKVYIFPVKDKQFPIKNMHQIQANGSKKSNRLKMSPAPLAMRMASSIAIANQAGKIIHDLMSAGELGILEKVSRKNQRPIQFTF